MQDLNIEQFIKSDRSLNLSRLTKSKEGKLFLELASQIHGIMNSSQLAYRVLHNMKDFPNCKGCNKILNEKNFINFKNGYSKFCSVRCSSSSRQLSSEEAIEKLNNFGNLQYISGFETRRSVIIVKNENCGCIFKAVYNNLFTNVDYCPTHGAALRNSKLKIRNKEGLSLKSKDKRKNTFTRKKELKKECVKLEDITLESIILSSNRLDIISFIESMKKQSGSKIKHMLSRYKKLYMMIEQHYGYRFGQKLYNYIHYIDNENAHPKCIECNKIVNYGSFSNIYNRFCSQACKKVSSIVIEKMKQTQIIRYGGWHTKFEAYRDKSAATCIEKYGVRHPLQNKKVLEKVWKSQYRLKLFALPSGRVIKLMGYEPQVLNYLMNIEGFCEDEFEFDLIPIFLYGDKQLYFPDFYIPLHNLIIEVKSLWTLKNSLIITKQKQEAVERSNYNYRLIVWDDKQKIIINEALI